MSQYLKRSEVPVPIESKAQLTWFDGSSPASEGVYWRSQIITALKRRV